MAKTKIEWTDKTWNAVVGCTKVSAGCQNCYAERMAKRLRAMGNHKYHGVTDSIGWTGKIMCGYEELYAPQFWKKPCRIFVCSMGDLFHEAVTDQFIQVVFSIIQATPRHTYFILTKRPERMLNFMEYYTGGINVVPANLWLGVSVENSETVNQRIPMLLQTPAAHRFISYEPALGPIRITMDYEQGYGLLKWGDGPFIDWVIAGCESGPHRRPAQTDWFRSVRDQCIEAGVPFFLKQMEIDGKIVKMPELDGKVWDQCNIAEGYKR